MGLWALIATAFPVAVDLLHFVIFDDLNAVFVGWLSAPGVGAVVGILSIYAAFCVSLVFIGRLVPDIRLRTITLEDRDDSGRRRKTKTTWPQLLFFYPSLGFGVLMILLVANAVGIAEDASVFSEDAQMWLVLGATFVFFAHAIIAAIDIEPQHRVTEPGFSAVLVPTVLISELAINLAAAAWVVLLGDSELEQPGGVADLLVLVPLYLVFFAAPRFAFMSRCFTWPSLVSGLALVVWTVWQSLDVVAL